MVYTWVKKKLRTDYFGMVSGLNCVLQGVDGDKTETANFVLVIPEHEEEHADAWTEERINATAESGRENLEIEIARKVTALENAE